jgi:hypothetical protein
VRRTEAFFDILALCSSIYPSLGKQHDVAVDPGDNLDRFAVQQWRYFELDDR